MTTFPDPRILPRAGGERDFWALLRPDLCLWWNRSAGLQGERQPGSDPHLHRDGLPRGEGFPCCQRGEITALSWLSSFWRKHMCNWVRNQPVPGFPTELHTIKDISYHDIVYLQYNMSAVKNNKLIGMIRFIETKYLSST